MIHPFARQLQDFPGGGIQEVPQDGDRLPPSTNLQLCDGIPVFIVAVGDPVDLSLDFLNHEGIFAQERCKGKGF